MFDWWSNLFVTCSSVKLSVLRSRSCFRMRHFTTQAWSDLELPNLDIRALPEPFIVLIVEGTQWLMALVLIKKWQKSFLMLWELASVILLLFKKLEGYCFVKKTRPIRIVIGITWPKVCQRSMHWQTVLEIAFPRFASWSSSGLVGIRWRRLLPGGLK